MSLISLRNCMAPAMNKVHLITIVIIALAFGIYRASGGGVSVVNRNAPPVKQHIQKNTLKTSVQKKPPVKQNIRQRSPQKASDDDFLKSLLGNHAKKKEAAQPARNSRRGKDKGGLHDIEKSLGLRE